MLESQQKGHGTRLEGRVQARWPKETTRTAFTIPTERSKISSQDVRTVADDATALTKPLFPKFDPPPYWWGIGGSDEWSNPAAPRNKKMGPIGRTFLAPVDFVSQGLYWTLKPLFVAVRWAFKDSDKRSKLHTFSRLFLAGIPAVALMQTGIPTLFGMLMGLGAAGQRLITGRSSFPRIQDIGGGNRTIYD
jgi:hypothetical protein